MLGKLINLNLWKKCHFLTSGNLKSKYDSSRQERGQGSPLWVDCAWSSWSISVRVLALFPGGLSHIFILLEDKKMSFFPQIQGDQFSRQIFGSWRSSLRHDDHPCPLLDLDDNEQSIAVWVSPPPPLSAPPQQDPHVHLSKSSFVFLKKRKKKILILLLTNPTRCTPLRTNHGVASFSRLF